LNDEKMKRSTGGESPGPLGTESWRALLAAVPQLIWTAGPDGTVDYLSERWASYTGLPLEKLRRMHWEALIHPHDRLHVLEHWQQSRANGADIDARLRLRHASGEWRWQLARGAAVHAGSGEIEHWVGTLTDIHDQVVSEQDTELLDEVGERCRRATDERELLAYVTERLASYFDAEQAFLAELELDGDSVHVAAGFHRTGASLARKHSLESFGPPTAQAARAGHTMAVADVARDPRTAAHFETSYGPLGLHALVSAALVSGGSHCGAFLLGAASPRVWQEREVNLFETAAERAWLAVIRLRDAAARSEHEAELLAARNEAERLRSAADTANRMKDEFLATVSHELRAPLNAIGGWAGVLRVGKLDAAGISKAATVIEKNVRAQAKMIEDLLDVSRIVSGRLRLEPRTFDPAISVEGAIETMRPAASEKNIRIEYAKSAGARSISGDPHRLQQAVWNLLSNAVKFSEAGGRVCVGHGQRDGAVEIAVSDNGAGIAPEFLPHIFKRFQQGDGATQRRFGGLGLGLAIVRHIVELHGGRVEARSDGIGRGSTFIIRIPVALEEPAGARSPATAAVRVGSRDRSAAPHDSLAGLRLLSVDDEPDASEMLKAALEQYGAQVTTVTSAAAALDLLGRQPFDVLVSDIGMPGMNGYELLERIRAGAVGPRTIPAIAVTGYARSEDRERALRAGYEAHVVKPIEPEELAATVRAAASAAGARQ
jgi:PAS domain S-box-containing protein